VVLSVHGLLDEGLVDALAVDLDGVLELNDARRRRTGAGAGLNFELRNGFLFQTFP
jgi:hypothetical protein